MHIDLDLRLALLCQDVVQFAVKLPENAFASNFSMTIRYGMINMDVEWANLTGRFSGVEYVAEIMEKEAAEREFGEAIEQASQLFCPGPLN